MKKVGLLTLNSRSFNYGGVLQEYALQKTIVALGYDCEIIDYDFETEFGMFSYKRNLRYLTLGKLLRKFYREKNGCRNGIDITSVIKKRHDYFNSFRDNYMKLSVRCDCDSLIKVQEDYDALVCGSDQIWSPSLTKPSFFLDFVNDNRGKVIYAASISRNELSKEERRVYGKYLARLKHISVREERAKELVDEILVQLGVAKRDVMVVLDPTLLIDASSWRNLAGDEPLVKGRYIFCYFLGLTEEKRNAATSFAKKHDIKLISMPYLLERYNALDVDFSEDLFPVGPIEFLNLISHAEFVLTDSFHASVFSILFNKRFRVFGRNSGKDNMNSRIKTLLGYIERPKYLIEPSQLDGSAIDESINYDFNVINEKKEMSIWWLKNSIGYY